MNGFEFTAREKKAGLMATALRAYGITAESAQVMSDAEWGKVAQCAGCKAPNSQETRDAVVAKLDRHSAPARMNVIEFRKRTEEICRVSTGS